MNTVLHHINFVTYPTSAFCTVSKVTVPKLELCTAPTLGDISTFLLLLTECHIFQTRGPQDSPSFCCLAFNFFRSYADSHKGYKTSQKKVYAWSNVLLHNWFFDPTSAFCTVPLSRIGVACLLSCHRWLPPQIMSPWLLAQIMSPHTSYL